MWTGTHQHQAGLELKLSATKAKSSIHPRNREPGTSSVTRSFKAHNPPKPPGRGAYKELQSLHLTAYNMVLICANTEIKQQR